MTRKREPVKIDASGALCAEIDPELWFPSADNDEKKSMYSAARYAKSVCAKCPLITPCLLTAVANKEEYGIWGGSSPRDRRAIRSKAQAKKFIVELQAKFQEEEAKKESSKK